MTLMCAWIASVLCVHGALCVRTCSADLMELDGGQAIYSPHGIIRKARGIMIAVYSRKARQLILAGPCG